MRYAEYLMAILTFLFLSACVAGYARSEGLGDPDMVIDLNDNTVVMEVGDGIWMNLGTGAAFTAPSTGEGQIIAPVPQDDFGDYLGNSRDWDLTPDE